MELRRRLTTELSIAGCRKEPTFHRKSQSSREMSCSCCVKEGKMTLHNGVSFGHSIREAPIYQVFYFSNLLQVVRNRRIHYV